MKTMYAVTLSVLLLLVSACVQKVNDPADVQAVKKIVDDYAKAVNAGDASAIVASTTDKTIFAYPNSSGFVGKEAIRSAHQAFTNVAKAECSVPVEEVRVAGDLAIARGTWSEKVTPNAQGVASASYSGSWIASFARQSDGSWKWDWLVPNSNKPEPGSTASGEDEEALFQIERAWGEATITKDMTALDRILAPEFQANYVGLVGNKKQILSVLKSDTSKTESSVVSDMKAMVFGDRAVVNGLSTEKSITAGKDTSGQYRWTDVFVKRDGRWQCVTGYASKVQ